MRESISVLTEPKTDFERFVISRLYIKFLLQEKGEMESEIDELKDCLEKALSGKLTNLPDSVLTVLNQKIRYQEQTISSLNDTIKKLQDTCQRKENVIVGLNKQRSTLEKANNQLKRYIKAHRMENEMNKGLYVYTMLSEITSTSVFNARYNLPSQHIPRFGIFLVMYQIKGLKHESGELHGRYDDSLVV